MKNPRQVVAMKQQMIKREGAEPIDLRTLIQRGIKAKGEVARLETKLKATQTYEELSKWRERLAKIEAALKVAAPVLFPNDLHVMVLAREGLVESAVEIERRRVYEVDALKADALKVDLGDAWDSIFSVHREITRSRAFGSWMSRAQGALESFKEKIVAAVTEKAGDVKIRWPGDKKDKDKK